MKPNGRRRFRKMNARFRQRGSEVVRERARTTSAGKARKLILNDFWGGDPLPLPSRPFSPRSLVGMSETSKRRLFRQAIDALPQEQRAANLVRLFRLYRIGERLRPCPNPWCSKEDGCVLRECHGSGVLPARGRG